MSIFFLLTCFHSQVLKFLWYHFGSSAYFKSLIKKNQNNENYFKYVQVESTGYQLWERNTQALKKVIHFKNTRVKNTKAYAQIVK